VLLERFCLTAAHHLDWRSVWYSPGLLTAFGNVGAQCGPGFRSSSTSIWACSRTSTLTEQTKLQFQFQAFNRAQSRQPRPAQRLPWIPVAEEASTRHRLTAASQNARLAGSALKTVFLKRGVETAPTPRRGALTGSPFLLQANLMELSEVPVSWCGGRLELRTKNEARTASADRHLPAARNDCSTCVLLSAQGRRRTRLA